MKWFIVFLFFSATAHAGLIANTLFLECRGEPRAGQLACASVIYNRATAGRKSFIDVILTPRHFSCWNNGVYVPQPASGRECAIMMYLESIELKMVYRSFVPTTTANHYYSINEKPPYWAPDLKDVFIIGNHVFGTIK